MNIYIRIELLARELQGRLLLALVAADRGHEVLLGKIGYSFFANTQRPGPLPAGLYHDKSLGVTAQKRAFHEHLANRGFLISVQDEEHGLAEDSLASMAVRFDDDAMARTALYCAWGEFDKSGLNAMLPNHVDRIVVTGSPRVDFWRPEARSLFRQGAGEPRETPVILYVASGGEQLFPMPPIWGLLAESDLGSDDSIVAARRFGKAVEFTAAAGHAIHELGRRFPSARVVVRPHPANQPGAWEGLLHGAPPNVAIATDNSVSQWLERSSVIILNGSTVGFEATIAGRPCIAFSPRGFNYGPAVNRVLQQASSVSELLEAVQQTLSDSQFAQRSSAATHALEYRFAALKGRLAADRITDRWEEIGSQAGIRQADLLQAIRVLRRRRRLTKRASRDSGSRGEHWTESKEVARAKFPPFDLAEISRLHQDLAKSLRRFEAVQITPVHSRLLHLRRLNI